jgi:hypothetical protein
MNEEFIAQKKRNRKGRQVYAKDTKVSVTKFVTKFKNLAAFAPSSRPLR